MAVTPALLAGGFGASTTDGATPPGSPFSVTYTQNRPVLVFLGSTKGSTPDIPTITDNKGNTYTGIRTRAFNSTGAPTKRGSLFVVVPNANGTAVVTPSWGGNTQTGFYWDFTDLPTVTNSVPVQSTAWADDVGGTDADNEFNNTLPPTASSGAIAAFADPVNNLCICWIMCAASSTPTVGAGMTLLHSDNFASPTAGWITQYKVGEILNPTASWTGSATRAGIMVEIAAPTSTGGGPLNFFSRDI